MDQNTARVLTPTELDNPRWAERAQTFEYTSAANPVLPKIDVVPFPASLHQIAESKIIPLDLSSSLGTNYSATTPNLMASFIHIAPGESLATACESTSEVYYVIRGKGRSESEDGTIEWKSGDLFTLPYNSGARHYAEDDTAIYWVHDGPLLQYLGVKPTSKQFAPALYSHEMMQARLEATLQDAAASKRNRNGVLLANPACPLTKTLTHTMWSLYNKLPAGVMQKPHRHNSIALDMAVYAGPNTYTLIGSELNADGSIKNPVRADWVSGSVFVTPPGWWHSHHNDSDEDAYVLPIQDAGLVTYQRILDIQFS